MTKYARTLQSTALKLVLLGLSSFLLLIKPSGAQDNYRLVRLKFAQVPASAKPQPRQAIQSQPGQVPTSQPGSSPTPQASPSVAPQPSASPTRKTTAPQPSASPASPPSKPPDWLPWIFWGGSIGNSGS